MSSAKRPGTGFLSGSQNHPGKPADNAFSETFNGRFRDKCANSELCLDLEDSQHKLAPWQLDYTMSRSHSSLGDLSPVAFVAPWRPNRPDEDDFLRPELIGSEW